MTKCSSGSDADRCYEAQRRGTVILAGDRPPTHGGRGGGILTSGTLPPTAASTPARGHDRSQRCWSVPWHPGAAPPGPFVPAQGRSGPSSPLGPIAEPFVRDAAAAGTTKLANTVALECGVGPRRAHRDVGLRGRLPPVQGRRCPLDRRSGRRCRNVVGEGDRLDLGLPKVPVSSLEAHRLEAFGRLPRPNRSPPTSSPASRLKLAKNPRHRPRRPRRCHDPAVVAGDRAAHPVEAEIAASDESNARAPPRRRVPSRQDPRRAQPVPPVGPQKRASTTSPPLE